MIRSASFSTEANMQLQQATLPERLKVWEALELFASFYGTPADWRRLLEQWDLTEKRNASFASLSGGQRQRLFIALALVGDPEVVILDELTSGLDPQARWATWELIRAVRDAGTTVVLVTHFMDEAERLCDRLAIIDEGRVVAQGSPRDMIGGLELEGRVRFSANGSELGFLEAVAGVRRVSGAALPRGLLSETIQNVAMALPLTHVVTVVDDAWSGAGWNPTAMLVLSGVLVAGVALSTRLFRWE